MCKGKFLISKFRLVVNVVFFSFGWFPGVWILYADLSEHSVCSIFRSRVNTTSEDGTDAGESPKRKNTREKFLNSEVTKLFRGFCLPLVTSWQSCRSIAAFSKVSLVVLTFSQRVAQMSAKRLVKCTLEYGWLITGPLFIALPYGDVTCCVKEELPGLPK